MVDIELLKRSIEESGFKMEFIADKAKMNERTLKRRLNGEGEFTANEIMGLSCVLKLNASKQKAIFFTDKGD